MDGTKALEEGDSGQGSAMTKWVYGFGGGLHDYSDAVLREWAARLGGQSWDRTFVFFKHEDAGAGPKMAARFIELCG